MDKLLELNLQDLIPAQLCQANFQMYLPIQDHTRWLVEWKLQFDSSMEDGRDRVGEGELSLLF